jgi:hypothetical protein
MKTHAEASEDFQRELANCGRIISDALGLERLVRWLNDKLTRT